MKIGFVAQMADSRLLKRAPRYSEIRDIVQQVEESGFDSVWLYDHLLYRFEPGQTIGIWECWSFMAALAEATQRVELGALVSCTQFRNPALLAKMAETVDEISSGRLILGLGAGWNVPEFEAFGYPSNHLVDRFEETLQIIHPLIKTGRCDFAGQYYQAKDCEITPRGPRPGGIPILMGAFGPRMLSLAARYADAWNTCYLTTPDTLDEPLGKLQTAMQAEGRDPATMEITVLVSLGYPDIGEPPKPEDPYLSGTEEELACVMKGYADKGVSHLMFHTNPHNSEAVDRLSKAVYRYKQNIPV